ncbi:Carboxylesterase, partial [Syncephalis pseudoplumigaleata]
TDGDGDASIPFAEPPVGPYRFRKPQPARSWQGIRDATKSTPACPQLMPTLRQSEDCLHLDIYTPSMNRIRQLSHKLPVIVWIFPGSHKNMLDMYDGSYLAETHEQIIVSINHRLGPFGFISAEGADTNVGLFDQREALRWIARNIKYFHGDPDNITIMGESSGAYSVLAHMAAREKQPGLFHKAIVMS